MIDTINIIKERRDTIKKELDDAIELVNHYSDQLENMKKDIQTMIGAYNELNNIYKKLTGAEESNGEPSSKSKVKKVKTKPKK